MGDRLEEMQTDGDGLMGWVVVWRWYGEKDQIRETNA
jgi:hypothetical protein